jgi:hypothetical protein
MRNASNNISDNDFRKFLSFQRDFVQNEISRFARIEDKTESRRRNGPVDFGGQQLMNVSNSSDYAIVGGSGGSTTVGL